MASFASPSTKARYIVRSSDVISDMRVNVLEEGTERILWYKERFLADEEIVENVFEHATNRLVWTVHRPKRGWYLRLRSPAFPPGMYIVLRALPSTDPNFIDGALAFGCRTNAIGPSGSGSARPSLSRDESAASTHSYPPTPPVVPRNMSFDETSSSSPPPSSRVRLSTAAVGASRSASTSTVALASSSTTTLISSSSPPRRPIGAPMSTPQASQITNFLLLPQTIVSEVAKSNTGLFARAFAILGNHQPSSSYSYSFTLRPAPPPPATTSTSTSPSIPSLTTPNALLPTSSSIVIPNATRNGPSHLSDVPIPQTPLPPPLLSFHDQTSTFNVASISGLIELDLAAAQAYGVHPSFWVTAALAYLEFLEEREAYIAAAEG